MTSRKAGITADPDTGAETPRAKLIIGAIVAEPAAWAAAQAELSRTFGPFDPAILSFTFDHTTYYHDEMGADLVRIFRVFRDTVAQDDLVEIKRGAMRIERIFEDRTGAAPRRRVNLDPGLLHLAGLVLATTKGYCHRIYLGRGIFAEPTLIWKGNGFHPLEWTYPDYRTAETLAFFTEIRRSWRRKIREEAAPTRLSSSLSKDDPE